MIQFRKFPEINQFHNIRKYAMQSAEKFGGPTEFMYNAKVKLHGTNAGITVNMSGEIAAQSRTRLITMDDDNFGFAQYVESNKDYFRMIGENACHKLNVNQITFFGEWYGKGIQQKVAASEVDKSFAVFMVLADDTKIFMPMEIGILLNSVSKNIQPKNLHVLPFIWYRHKTVDFSDAESCNEFAAAINQVTLDVEECDPFIKEEYNIEGLGEGIVLYPVHSYTQSKHHILNYSNYMFKSKGQKHDNVRKQRTPTVVDPEVIQNTKEFVEQFVTEARLKQIAERDANNEFDKNNTSKFLGAFMQDVQKESVDEVLASNIEWKHLQRAVSYEARKWWLNKCDGL